MANDEPTLNVRLADALGPKNPRWRVAAHQLGVLSGGRQPDLVVTEENKAPVILEVEYWPATGVEREARGRVGSVLQPGGQKVESVIAVAAPARLRQVAPEALAEELLQADLDFCLYSAAGEDASPVRWPDSGWLQGDVNYLANLVEHASVSESLLDASLEILESAVSQAAHRLENSIRAGAAFGPELAARLHQEEGEQTLRMAMAIVANALAFQTSLTHLPDLSRFDEFRGIDGKRIVPGKITVGWRRILLEINYWPIFSIADSVMSVIPIRPASEVLTLLATAAEALAAQGVTRSHDLTGRMFQRLIADRKFLATFYTRPESAWLLSDLAVGMLPVNWSSRAQVTGLRIGDLACGTGALLSAAYGALGSRFRHAGGDDAEIHPELMESGLIGADIMPAATHLTASMLSSAHPSLTFEQTQIFTLPYGRHTPTHTSIGSLDLIGGQVGRDLFGPTGETVRGSIQTEGGTEFELPHGALDLVIMNPPFTRPTNHKLAGVPVPSFAGFGTTGEEQAQMSKVLGKVRAELEHTPAGNGNAGLASNFLDLAHLKLRPGGILAMVMPLSLLQGASWAAARNLLSDHYRDLTVITIAGAGSSDKSFSADTGMGEALILGRRSQPDQERGNQVDFVNLRRSPQSLNEAIQIARSVREFERGLARSERIRIGDDPVGVCMRGSIEESGLAGVIDPELALAALSLTGGRLGLDGRAEGFEIPITKLGALGQRGLIDRDINGRNPDGRPRGPFDIVPIAGAPSFPVLWAHVAERERTFVVEPDSMGQLRDGMDVAAEKVWSKATRLHISRDFRLNSQSLAACLTPDRSIGGQAWPNFVVADPAWEAPLLLWFNSTLGLICYWWEANRQQAGRARLTVTKLPEIPVLGATKMTQDQVDCAAARVEELNSRTFLPANEAFGDQARDLVDRFLLIDVLGLPESALEITDVLRRKWCAEPSVHGGALSKPPWSY